MERNEKIANHDSYHKRRRSPLPTHDHLRLRMTAAIEYVRECPLPNGTRPNQLVHTKTRCEMSGQSFGTVNARKPYLVCIRRRDTTEGDDVVFMCARGPIADEGGGTLSRSPRVFTAMRRAFC